MSETLFKPRSPNYKSVEITTPTAGYTAGDFIKVQQLCGVVVETKTVGQKAVLVYSCEKIVVPKTTGETFAIGAKVYLNATTGKATSTASGNTLCGRANELGESADTEIEITLNGDLAA